MLLSYVEIIYEPAPCQMVYSRFGCCWDGKSIPKGPNGEGCPGKIIMKKYS